MILNPFRKRRERKAEENRQRALAGKTTSGYLSPGERQGHFRALAKRRQK